MLHLLKIEENGAKPFMLVRSTTKVPPGAGNVLLSPPSPKLELIGCFDRDEVVQLGEAITDTLASE